jgi:cytochrome c-type biogenesis protein CcmE
MLMAVAYLVVMGMQSATVYFLTVSELQAKGPAAVNQNFRVSGLLVPGTLVREGTSIHFAVADATSTPLAMSYHGGQIPDIVGDDVEIVAEGRLGADGTFVASQVLAKCPSRLENAEPEAHTYSG